MAAGNVRIDRYESRVDTPSGQIAGAEGRAVPMPEIRTDLWANAFANVAEAQAQSQVNNARAELATLEPQAQLDFRNQFNTIKQSWAPGQEPAAKQMGDYIDNYTTNVLSKTSNPRAQEMIRARANELKTSYQLQSADFQVGAEVDYRTGQYVNGYQTVADLGVQQPAKFGFELAKLNATVMADNQLSLEQKQKLIQKNSKEAAYSVSKVRAESDPAVTLAMVNARLGITEPTISGFKGDVRDAIIQNESGGQMYDDQGNVLAGPEITTKDGSKTRAFGKYQMLDSTAQQQAAKLGLPWDPELFHRKRTGDAAKDAETAAYHDQLGQAYIADQSREFGGNPVLVAAAHNMGPEATRGWAAGRPYQTQSGKWWYPDKPMDMSALPDETRQYIGKLGKVEDATPAVDLASEDAVPYQLLDGEQLLSVRSAAQSRIAELNNQKNAKFEVDRALFNQRISDTNVALKSGEPVEIPSFDEMATFLGPAQAIIKTREMQAYQNLAGALKELPSLSNGELAAAASMPNPEGVDNREARQFSRDAISKEADRILADRKNDPGLAAQSAPGVQTAYGQWISAAKDFKDAGQNATMAQLNARDAAQANYINTSFSQQRAWGIIEPKLPNDVLTGLSQGFNVAMQGGDFQTAAMSFSRLPEQLGSHAAITQVGEKTGDLGWFAMEGVSPAVLNQLYQSKQLKGDEQAKSLPSNTKPSDLNKAVQTAFSPLLLTLNTPNLDGAQNDPGAAGRYARNGYDLAASYLISGQASSAKEAANMAYKSLYLDRETIQNGVRIPNSYDADKVTQGLGLTKSRLKPEQMYIPAPPAGMTKEEGQARILRNVQENGKWVTDETGKGAYLMVAGKPALDAAGKPIRSTFDQAVGQNPYQDQPVNYTELYRQTIQGLR